MFVVPSTSDESLRRFKASLFFSQSIADGQTVSGIVFAEPAPGPFLKLVVPIEGKPYEILFERVKEKSLFTNLD